MPKLIKHETDKFEYYPKISTLPIRNMVHIESIIMYCSKSILLNLKSIIIPTYDFSKHYCPSNMSNYYPRYEQRDPYVIKAEYLLTV